MFLNEGYGYDSYEADSVFDESGQLLQICLESEISWGNIMQASMNSQHVALMEDGGRPGYLYNESVKDTFHNIIEWIKDHARKIANWFKTLIIRVKEKSGAIARWCGENKNRVLSSNEIKYNGYKYSRVPVASTFLGDAREVYAIIQKKTDVLQGRVNTDTIKFEKDAEEVKEFMDDLKKKSISDEINKAVGRSDKTEKDIKVSKSDIAKWFKYLQEFGMVIKYIDSLQKESSIYLNKMMGVAKSGLKTADDDTKKNITKTISCAKALLSYGEAFQSASVSATFQAASTALAICKKAAKSGSDGYTQDTNAYLKTQFNNNKSNNESWNWAF